jgi:hypothetical protein
VAILSREVVQASVEQSWIFLIQSQENVCDWENPEGNVILKVHPVDGDCALYPKGQRLVRHAGDCRDGRVHF